MNEHPRIAIIGAGPTGLGAAWRLSELGYENWSLFDAADVAGGLASSVVDKEGFVWDLGGHVVFSHYEYFDNLLDNLLGDQWCHHQRESWVWMRNRFIPYPLQNNIWRLPQADLKRCLDGLEKVAKQCPAAEVPATFGEWIDRSFGHGLAEIFMRPYNFKVWAYDPSTMSNGWVGQRVAMVDLERIRENIANKRDDVGWGPNATFRFPLHGGTGAIWHSLKQRLPVSRLHFGKRVVAIDTKRQCLTCEDGRVEHYDHLISTMPINSLLRLSSGLTRVQPLADKLVYSSTHIVGIGLGAPAVDMLSTKCWIYFPESDVPFYRVTVFSNYSPNNVPIPGRQSSLMAEVSESPMKPVDVTAVVSEVEAGLKHIGMIRADTPIVSRWHRRLEYGYPTPFLGRDALLAQIEPALREANIFSRGRFGGWRYEVANQDHSAMQGVEAVDHILFNADEVTCNSPQTVNGGGKMPAAPIAARKL